VAFGIGSALVPGGQETSPAALQQLEAKAAEYIKAIK